jgi:hypothetical protein
LPRCNNRQQNSADCGNTAAGIGIAVILRHDAKVVSAFFARLFGSKLFATSGNPFNHKRLESLLGITPSQQTAEEVSSMRSTKRITTYLMGAGLALSVAAFAPLAFAQDSGANGANAGSTSPSTMPNNAASAAAGDPVNNSAVTPPSGPINGSNKATNPDPAADPDPATNSNSMNGSAPGSSAPSGSDSSNTAP